MELMLEAAPMLEQFEALSLKQLDALKLMNRIDTKFVLPASCLLPLLSKASVHYKVLEIEGKRAMPYYTRYLDTEAHKLYLDHQNGRAVRYKIRYRTYLTTNDTFLEIKQKTNKGKTLKSRIKANAQNLLQPSDFEYMQTIVALPTSPLNVASENWFNRITLASFVTNERITIDYGLTFKCGASECVLPNIIIVELKRERSLGKTPMQLILKNLKAYQRGFSKYCMGMALLKEELKKNSFKKNLLFINKLNNYVLSR
jgi:hypothetical protein